MEGNAGFVLKVVVVSAILSISIKYGGPLLLVPPNSELALCLVLLPSTLLAIALLWRKAQQRQAEEIR